MNVYDFDGTICYPDSAVHFAFWCINRHPLMWVTFFPKALKNLILYKKGKMTRAVMMREFYGFLKIRDFISMRGISPPGIWRRRSRMT